MSRLGATSQLPFALAGCAPRELLAGGDGDAPIEFDRDDTAAARQMARRLRGEREQAPLDVDRDRLAIYSPAERPR